MILGLTEETQEQKLQRWQTCDPSTREAARQAFMTALMSPVGNVSHTAASVLAAYGKFDMTVVDGLLPVLKHIMESDAVAEKTKISALETMGYLCDAMDPDAEDFTKDKVDTILTGIIGGMHESQNIAMRRAATSALENTLVFAEKNFEDPTGHERNMIMQSIRSAMICQDDFQVRESAYKCLIVVAENYYNFLGPYIEELFSLSMGAITKGGDDGEPIGKLAIEFWAIIADDEIDRNDELEDGVKPDEVKHQYIMKKVTPVILPIILQCLTVLDEDDDEDVGRISDSAHALLERLALCVGDDVVPLVLPFVQQHIQNPDWKFRDAAVCAFGFILDGPKPETLYPIVQQASATLINLIQDKSEIVAVSSLWTMSKICEYHKQALPETDIPPLVNAMILSLSRESLKIQSKACLCVNKFAEACEDNADKPTNILSAYVEAMVKSIFGVITTYSIDDKNNEIVLQAYEAINQIIASAALDVKPFIIQVLAEAIGRLDKTFEAGHHLAKGHKYTLQGHLSALCGHCVQRLDSIDLTDDISDRIVTSILRVVSDPESTALQDAYMTLGFLIDRLENRYLRYAETVMPPLFAALERSEDHVTCSTAVNVMGDICRAIKDKIAPWCDKLIQTLLELLKSADVQKSVKPYVISLFSDIALAIESNWGRYASVVMNVLGKAVDSAKLSANKEDGDHDDFVYSIREAIFEAYTGTILAMEENKTQDEYIGPHVEKILTFVVEACNPLDDDDRPSSLTKAAIGVLGDLSKAFGVKVQPFIQHEAIQNLLKHAINDGDEEVRESAKWVNSINARK
jgi:importin subunit beta-1